MLFSCPEQLNRWPCPLVCLSDQTNNPSLHKNTEWSHTLVTFGTFDQSNGETWPDQKRSTYLHIYLPTFLSTSIREHPKGAIIGTCDIWDTDQLGNQLGKGKMDKNTRQVMEWMCWTVFAPSRSFQVFGRIWQPPTMVYFDPNKLASLVATLVWNSAQWLSYLLTYSQG